MKKIFFGLFVILSMCRFANAQFISSTDYSLAPLSYSSSANIKPTSDSGFVVAFAIRNIDDSQAYGTMLSKFDKTSKLSWTKYFYHIINSAMDIVEYPGGYLATGRTSASGFHMFKLNKNGEIVSKTIFEYIDIGYHGGYSIHMLNNKDILIYGIHEEQPSGNSSVVILKTDTSGNYKWSKEYAYTYSYVRAISDELGNIVAAYNDEILSIDSLGSVNFNLKYINGIPRTYSNNGLAIGGNAYLATSMHNDTNFVYKVNSQGVVEWTSNHLNMRINNIISYKNSLLFAGTYVFRQKVIGFSVAKMDYNGKVLWQNAFDMDTTAISARIIELKNKKLALLSIYPQKFRITMLNHPNVMPCGSNVDINLDTTIGAVNYSYLFPLPKVINLSRQVSTDTSPSYSFQNTLVCQAVDSTIKTSKSASICEGDSIFLANKFQKVSGVYLDSLITSSGRDSVVITNLMVHTPYNIQSKPSICKGDSIFILGKYRKSPGVFVDNSMSINGCDSVTTYTLTVNSLPSKPVITKSCNTLISTSGNGYQWFLNDTLISGATEYALLVKEPGSYSVSVKDNHGCKAESDTFKVTDILPECEYTIVAFPNPYNETIHIQYNLPESRTISLEVYNVLGEPIYTIVPSQEQAAGLHNYDFSFGSTGVYMLQFKIGNYSQVLRLVKTQ